jgi:hypothetical protein
MTANSDFKPHLFDGEYELLRGELTKARSYLEFGTGGSTLFAAECGIRRIVSVDSDRAWSDRIGERLASARSKINIELIHCNIGRTGDWGVPLGREEIANWPQYFVQPWQRFLDAGEIPDLIYVDGRFRVACVLYSLLNLPRRRLFRKATRIMIHDFSERPHYSKILDYTSVVAHANTLAVLEPKASISRPEVLHDLISFQFDYR